MGTLRCMLLSNCTSEEQCQQKLTIETQKLLVPRFQSNFESINKHIDTGIACHLARCPYFFGCVGISDSDHIRGLHGLISKNQGFEEENILENTAHRNGTAQDIRIAVPMPSAGAR